MDSIRYFLSISAWIVLTLDGTSASRAQDSSGDAAQTIAQSEPGEAYSANELYALAAALYDQQQWEPSIARFRQLIQRFPEEADATSARFYLGEALMQIGQFDEARAIFEAINQTPGDETREARAKFRAAECAYLLNDLPTAKTRFEEFKQSFGAHPLIEFVLPYLGELYLRTDDPDQAYAIFELALDRFPDSSLNDKCRLGLAQSAQQLGRTAEAKQVLAAIDSTAYADDALVALGKLCAQQRQWQQAAAHFEKITADFPDSELAQEAAYLLAKSHMNLGQWEQAWSRFQALVDQTWPSSLKHRVWSDAAITAINARQFDESKQLLRKVLADNPADDIQQLCQAKRIEIASHSESSERIHELYQEFKRLHADSIHHVSVLDIVARRQYADNLFSAAATSYFKLLEMTENDSRYQNNQNVWRYLLALAQIGDGKYESAISQLDQITNFNGNDDFEAAAYFARAAALAGNDKFKDSIGHYRRYLEISPNGPDAGQCRAGLALALANSNDLESAAGEIDLAIQHSPADPNVLNACATVAEMALQNKQNQIATQLFEHLSRSSDKRFADRGMTGLVWAAGDEESAQKQSSLARVVEALPESELAAETIVRQARQLQRQNQHEQAKTLLEQLLSANPDSKFAGTAQLYLALSNLRLGGEEHTCQAIQSLENLVNDDASKGWLDLAWYELAWATWDAGDRRRAAEAFAHLVKNFPNSPYRIDAMFRRATLARLAGNHTEARQQFEELLKVAPDHPLACHAIYAMGEMAAQQRNWNLAIENFELLLARSATHDQSLRELELPARYWLAESHFQLGKIPAAVEQFQSVRSDTGIEQDLQPIILLRLAQCAAHQEDWNQVEELVNQWRETFPHHGEVYRIDYLHARCEMSRGRFEQARQLLRQVIRHPQALDTNSAAMAQWMIGESFFHQRDYQMALQAYLLVDATYDFDTWRALALLQAAKCHEQLNHRALAVRTFRRVVTEFPGTEWAEQASAHLSRLVAYRNHQRPQSTRVTEQSKTKTIPATYSGKR